MNSLRGLIFDDRPNFKTKIEGTPFGFLLSYPKLQSNNAFLSASVVRWDKSKGFWIFDMFLPFGVEDVSLITCLPQNGREVLKDVDDWAGQASLN